LRNTSPGHELMMLMDQKGISADALQLKDVRSLKKPNEYKQYLSTDSNVYYRADLLRLLIARETIQQFDKGFFCYTDIDIKPGKLEMFAIKAKKSNYYSWGEEGLAFLQIGAGFENGLFLVDQEKLQEPGPLKKFMRVFKRIRERDPNDPNAIYAHMRYQLRHSATFMSPTHIATRFVDAKLKRLPDYGFETSSDSES
jgi:hypothetical protein